MIDLRNFYVENIQKHNYYQYKFGKYLIDFEIESYEFYDDLDVINGLRKFLYPYNKDNHSDEEKFIYICFYLYCNGYIIDEYPTFLERPTNRWDLSYNMIRNTIILKHGDTYTGTVTWDSRRKLINNLNIHKKANDNLSDSINNIIKNISTRNASFQEMADDEKLKEICNCIEYILKQNGNFVIIDYSNSCEYLNNNIVKKYRNRLECFRHATKESLEERKAYSNSQKSFLIDYGILILNFLQSNLYKKK